MAVARDLADQRLEAVDLAFGEALGRLVEDQELRAEREAHRHLEQALVAVGEGAGGALGAAVEADAGEGREGRVARGRAAGSRCTASATLSKTLRRG